jgi:hypothetical protein
VNNRDLQSAGGDLLRFADRPEDAPIVHFNGPLTMRVHMETGVLQIPINYDEAGPKRRRWYEEHPPVPEERELVIGKSASLFAEVGTPGLGRGTFVALSAGAPPNDVHPVAEVEFPNADPTKPAINTRVVLRQRCCGSLFHESVPAPEEAGVGRAKVSLSYGDWKAGGVSSGTGDVQVAKRKPE